MYGDSLPTGTRTDRVPIAIIYPHTFLQYSHYSTSAIDAQGFHPDADHSINTSPNPLPNFFGKLSPVTALRRHILAYARNYGKYFRTTMATHAQNYHPFQLETV